MHLQKRNLYTEAGLLSCLQCDCDIMLLPIMCTSWVLKVVGSGSQKVEDFCSMPFSLKKFCPQEAGAA